MAKYTVTKKPLTANTIWDAKKGKVLCNFTNGKLETDDDAVAKTLKALGHTVTENKDAKQADNPPDDPDKDNKDDSADDKGADGDKGDGKADQDSGNNADNAQPDAKAANRRSRSGK